MALELIGRSGKEALRILEHRDVSYPKDGDGRQKIRSTIDGKKAFLVIVEDAQKIIVITGGEA